MENFVRTMASELFHTENSVGTMASAIFLMENSVRPMENSVRPKENSVRPMASGIFHTENSVGTMENEISATKNPFRHTKKSRRNSVNGQKSMICSRNSGFGDFGGLAGTTYRGLPLSDLPGHRRPGVTLSVSKGLCRSANPTLTPPPKSRTLAPISHDSQRSLRTHHPIRRQY
jgi:hypothetical protein